MSSIQIPGQGTRTETVSLLDAATGKAQGTTLAGTNRSGSITAGGTAQPLAAANENRRKLSVQNISSGDLWINETGGAAAVDAAGSFKIPAGSTFLVQTNQAVSVIGATTGQKWTATET